MAPLPASEVAAAAAPAPAEAELVLAFDTPLVLAAAELAWVMLPGSAWRSWYTCGTTTPLDRHPGRQDPLLAECAEVRDLAAPVVVSVRVERVGVARSRLRVAGGSPGLHRRYLAAVAAYVERAARERDALHHAWVASAPRVEAALLAAAALRAAGDLPAEDCARRATWLQPFTGWQEPVLARMLAAPDTCAAGLAQVWVAAGEDPGRVQYGAPSPGAAEALRGSLAAWPTALQAARTADLARWDAESAAAAETRAAHRRAVEAALTSEQRACRTSMLAGLGGPTLADAVRHPRGKAGQVVAWTLPWILWLPGEAGGQVDDGRGGVAWRLVLPEGVDLGHGAPPGEASDPTTLVVGVVEVGSVTSPRGVVRDVPVVRVQCAPTEVLPPELRPVWTVLDGWRLP